jgi:ligand-binding sensor domain-containing protein/signal transduction histidine kinase
MTGQCRGESIGELSRSGPVRLTRWIVFLLALCVAPLSWAGPQGEAALNYARALWRVSDGLPEETVQAIIASPIQQLWIGTTGGLARFDGAHMQIYGNGGARHLPVNSILCLAMGQNGVLWAGTEGGGLMRIDEKGWRAYSHADGLKNGFVRSVLQDSQGRLWAGTDEGLFLQHNERFERQNLGATGSSLAVRDIMEDRTHRIWVGGSELYSIDREGHSTRYALPGTESENRVLAMLQTANETVWVGTAGGLQEMKEGRFSRIPGLHMAVRSLMQSSDGTLWIGTIGNGLWTLQDGRLLRADTPGLLPSVTVLHLFEDATHQIWIGTQAGLVRLTQTIIHVVPLPQPGDKDVGKVAGNLLSGFQVAADHLYTVQGDTPHLLDLPQIRRAAVRNVLRAKDGSFWIGTEGSGAYHVRGEKTTRLLSPPELTSNSVRAFLETRDGEVWIATDEGVSRIRADGVEKLTESNGLAYFSTRSLLETSDGSVWIGTDHGLSRWFRGQFMRDAVTEAMNEEKVWSILQDRSGAVWFGTRDHGLFRYSNGSIEHLTTAQGLPTDSIYGILQDRAGVFWITGPNTIASLFEAEMDARRVSGRSLLNSRVYSMPFAAEGAQLYGGWQPSGYAAPDGSMWFPTNRGIARVRMPRQSTVPVPRIRIDAVGEDGMETAITTNLKVPARVNRLSFAFFAASLQRQDKLRFRWKLEGFDKDWTMAGPGRLATYTNLPAGRYRFRVAASDPARPGLLEQADIALIKEPHFYETWWFYLLSAIAVVTSIWGLHKLRMRQMEKRVAAVFEERERVAREMHDTVIQGCTGISAVLEALVGTGFGESAEGPQSELLNHARDQTRRTIDEARRAVWALRHRPKRKIDLIEALQKVASQSTRDGRRSVRVEHNVAHLEMGAGAANEILMAVREAVVNAIKHSGSETIVVDLRSNEKELTLSICDYGCGMREDRVSVKEMHYGIAGMQERMRRIGGRLQIEGRPGAGTTVRLHLRWGKVRKELAGV